MLKADEISFVSSISYPAFVPSQSMLVRSISPAPSLSASCAHSSASRPVSYLPPCENTFQPLLSGLLLASIATTIHWLPKISAPSDISSGFASAAELTDILSAPSRSIFLMSSTVLIPPPTVNGIKTRLATARTRSTTVLRLSLEAVMSKKTSSSAPALS